MINSDLLASRFHMMPGRETVEYRRRTGLSVAGSGSTLANVERRNPSSRDLPSDQQYIDQVIMVFHIWKKPFQDVFGAAAYPKKGDHLIDSDNNLWIVQSTTEELLTQRWNLSCAKGKN